MSADETVACVDCGWSHWVKLAIIFWALIILGGDAAVKPHRASVHHQTLGRTSSHEEARQSPLGFHLHSSDSTSICPVSLGNLILRDLNLMKLLHKPSAVIDLDNLTHGTFVPHHAAHQLQDWKSG